MGPMSTLYVGGHSPFRRKSRYRTLEEAMAAAMDGDTIVVRQRSVPLPKGLAVNRSVTIRGAGRRRPRLTVPRGVGGLLVGVPGSKGRPARGVALAMEGIDVAVADQANGLVMAAGCENRLSLERCDVGWTARARKASESERYHTFAGNGLGSMELKGCRLDGGTELVASVVRLEGCDLGGLDMLHTANRPVIRLAGDVRASGCALTGVMVEGAPAALEHCFTSGGLTLGGRVRVSGLDDRPSWLHGRGRDGGRRIGPLLRIAGGFDAAGEDGPLHVPQDVAVSGMRLDGADAPDAPVIPLDVTVEGRVTLSDSHIGPGGAPSVLRPRGGTLKLRDVMDRGADWALDGGMERTAVDMASCHGSLARLVNGSRASAAGGSPALARIQSMIGLGGVKERLRRLLDNSRVDQARRARGLTVAPSNNNMVFLGPPGTGKTTVASLMGRALRDAGALRTDRFVSRKIGDLKGVHVGEAARNMDRACEDAMGGVLFLDEAYALAADDVYTPDLVTELLKYTDERHAADLTVILAGYRRETEAMLDTVNPGLNRRFPNRIVFESYTPEELHRIALLKLADAGDRIEPDADAMLAAWIERTAAPLIAGDPNFGNAGWAATAVQDLITAHNGRLVAGGLGGDRALTTITAGDVEAFAASRAEAAGKEDRP